MSKSTFIEFPLINGRRAWINTESITAILTYEKDGDEFTSIVVHGCVYIVDMRITTVLHYLRCGGIEFPSLGDLDLRGEPGEVGGVK